MQRISPATSWCGGSFTSLLPWGSGGGEQTAPHSVEASMRETSRRRHRLWILWVLWKIPALGALHAANAVAAQNRAPLLWLALQTLGTHGSK